MAPKNPNIQNNRDTQSVQNDNTLNLFVQIPLNSNYDLRTIVGGGVNQNIINEEEEEVVFFEEPDESQQQGVVIEENDTRFEKGTYTSFSAIQQLVFRARYVAAKGGDIEALDKENIWDDPDAERIVNQIAGENDSLCNEFEGYYLSKCKPTVDEDGTLSEKELEDNLEYNRQLLYNIAVLLDVKTKDNHPENTVRHRLNELDKVLATNSASSFNVEDTFDFLNNVFAPSAGGGIAPLNTKLLGRNSATENNEFVPTEDQEFVDNRNLINSISLADLKDQTNLPQEAVSAIIAGCFFRPDVLGSTYEQTYSDLENTFNPLPKKKNVLPDNEFDVMVDTFFTHTASGDNRRSANIPLLAVPKARQMARFAMGNLTQLSDKRAVVEALENVVRVAGKYAMQHTQNDHALYAASKLVNDAMLTLDLPQFREISTLSPKERNMGRAVSNLYLANVDLIKLNYELHDALFDHRTNDLTKDDSSIGKKPIDNEDVKRVFDSIYVRRHYIESHLKMAAQYGNDVRPLTSEELTCSLNPAKYFDSLIKSNNVVRRPDSIVAAKNLEEFNVAFDEFSKAPISNAQINTISSSAYNQKLKSSMLSFVQDYDLSFCAGNSKALRKFYEQLGDGLKPISSDMLSLYEIQKQRSNINAVRSYLQFNAPYDSPFGQVILGSLLQDKGNRNPDMKNIKAPYTMQHFSPIAVERLYNGPQPGNLKRIKEHVNEFVKELNELDQMLAAVEVSRTNETEFIKDCIKDPDQPLGPDIDLQFKKKGIEGISKSAMISKSYKVGQSLGLSELLIKLQENYKSSEKSLIVKKARAEAKKFQVKQGGSDAASRSTRQSRQSKAVQSIRSFVSTRSDMSSVSRADNAYSITLENLEVLKDDLSVNESAQKNEKIASEVEKLQAAKKKEENPKKKKNVVKGPSTNWGAKLDPNAAKEPPQLDTLSELSNDMSVKVFNLSEQERQRLYKEAMQKKLDMDTQKVKLSIESRFSNANKDLAMIEEDEADEYDEAENDFGEDVDPRQINVGITAKKFNATALLNTISPPQEQNKEAGLQRRKLHRGTHPKVKVHTRKSVKAEKVQPEKVYELPKRLVSFRRSTELIKPVDGALRTIDECLNSDNENIKPAIDAIRPVLEVTKKYYEDFKDVILSGKDGLSYLYDESGKPTKEFVTMEACRRLYKNTMQLPDQDSNAQVDYNALVETVTKDLTEKRKEYTKEDVILSFNDIMLPQTEQKTLTEDEFIENAFENIKSRALDPERLENLKAIQNPGIQYVVNSAVDLYTKYKDSKFKDIEKGLVDQSGVQYTPSLDYITMRLFSNINNNYDEYLKNPNSFNINNEIDKLENELAAIKNEGNIFYTTKDNVYYMFGVENPQESKERRTEEKFALRDQAIQVRNTLKQALPLGGQHYQKMLKDGIRSLDDFIGEFGEFGHNKIATDLSKDLTYVTVLPANVTRGERRIRHANSRFKNIQTAINLVNDVVKDNAFEKYDFENAKQAGEERDKVDKQFIAKIDQTSNQNEDFGIKLYSDIFNSLPKNIEKHIDALNKGIVQTDEYKAHKAELERLAEEKRAQEKIAEEKRQAKELAEFGERFDQSILNNKDEMQLRLKAEQYICDEIRERLENKTLKAPAYELTTIANAITRNSTDLSKDIESGFSVFQSLVNEKQRTVTNEFAMRKIFNELVSVSVNNGSLDIKYNDKSSAGKMLRDQNLALSDIVDSYKKEKFDRKVFEANANFLKKLSLNDVKNIIAAREKTLYERSPEYQLKLQNETRAKELLENPLKGEDLINELSILKNAFDEHVRVNGQVAVGAISLAGKASEVLGNIINDAKGGKSIYERLIDKETSKLTADGAALFTALEVYEVNNKVGKPSISVSNEGLAKYQKFLTGKFDAAKLPTDIPDPKLYNKLLQSKVVKDHNKVQKEIQRKLDEYERKLDSAISTEEDLKDLKNIILDNGTEIVNNLVVQKLALDKVIADNKGLYSPELKNLAKLGSNACANLVRHIARDSNFLKAVVANDNGKIVCSDDLALIQYCKKAFNINDGVISKNEDFSDNLEGKTEEELKNFAKENILEEYENSLTFRQVGAALKDESIQSWHVDMEKIESERFNIDEQEYYKAIIEASAEEDELNVAPQNPQNLAAKKNQIRQIKFNQNSKARFEDTFNDMKRDLLKQDAWYHRNSDLYKSVISKLNKTITAMQNPETTSESKLLTCYTELASACDAYVTKRQSNKFYTNFGHNRLNQISEIQDIVNLRIESIHKSKYRQAIAENATRFLYAKTNQEPQTPEQFTASVRKVLKNPIFIDVVQDKGIDELQQLARDPQALKKALRESAVDYAVAQGLMKVQEKEKVLEPNRDIPQI